MGSSGSFIGFLNSIPLWLYIVVAVLGLLITILLFVLSGRGRRTGGGGGAMAGGIAALLVLMIAPVTLMTIRLLNGPATSTTVAAGSSSTTSSGGFSSSTSSSSSGGYGSTSGGTSSGSTGGYGSSSDGSTTSSSSSSGGDGASGIVALVAQQFAGRLPLRSGPATITNVEANGSTLVMTMEISVNANGNWAGLEPSLRSNICGGPFARVVSMGGAVQVDVSDSTGDEHSVTVSDC